MAWPFRRRRDDLADEIQTHLAMAERDRVDRGEPPDRARANARREFGNVALVKQVTREVGRWYWLERFGHDLRIGYRRLWSRPTTTVTAVIMLGLAIGITTAMFTLADAFLLRPLPFRDADRIGRVWMRSNNGGRTAVAPAVLRAWRDSPVFEAAEGTSTEDVVLDSGSGPVVRASAFVSPGMFDMLGVHPIRGRLFETGEGQSGTSDRALISEDLWRGAFGADRDIVGRHVRVGVEPVVIVGVMPREFRFPAWNTQIWRPIDYDSQPPGPGRRPVAYLKFAAGVPELDALRAAAESAHAADGSTANLWAERARPVESYAGTQYVDAAVRLLMGGVALVFLVLCANASSLILARFNARRRDFSLCSALGASRRRLLWQASLESTCLGAAGAAVGIALAWWLVSAAALLLPVDFLVRSLNPLNIDGRAVAAAATLGIAATMFAGWLPAWIGTRSTQPQHLADRTTTDTPGGRALTRGLLITEVTLACALLVGATLLVRSFVNLSRVDLGFDPGGVMALWVAPNNREPDKAVRALTMERVAAELASLPGVRRVVASRGVPLFVENGNSSGQWQTDEPGAAAVPIQVKMYTVGPGWFDMYRIRLLQGRDFGTGEDPSHVIVGRQLAASLWPRVTPIGRTFQWGKNHYQVIGVVEDLRSPVEDLERDYTEIYFPLDASALASTLGLRCDDTCPSEGLVRQRILTATPGVDVLRFVRLEDVYREDLAQPRAMAMLGLVFGGLALTVAAGGLFSVMGHAVARRRREFGIRLAMGSSPERIRQMVLGDGLAMAAIGLGLGSAIGWAATKALGALLYGVTPSDPLSWTIVLLALLAATMAGAWRPAQQAMQADPATLLREN